MKNQMRHAQVKRRDRSGNEFTAHCLDEIRHHRFGAAVDETGIHLGGIDPFPGRAGRDVDLDIARRAELPGRFPDRKERTDLV
ncbi:MAG: hypothetical protein JO328_08980 [Hyphomicrobiales bacterium]|nr:hypothetical protein [Hyphomicrobiales bacterium]MBV9429691.1 hypothetical protein [Bradyrhizobiaceae bacterium]